MKFQDDLHAGLEGLPLQSNSRSEDETAPCRRLVRQYLVLQQLLHEGLAPYRKPVVMEEVHVETRSSQTSEIPKGVLQHRANTPAMLPMEPGRRC